MSDLGTLDTLAIAWAGVVSTAASGTPLPDQPTDTAGPSSSSAPPAAAAGASLCGRRYCSGISESGQRLLRNRHDRMTADLKAAWAAEAAAESRAATAEAATAVATARAAAAEAELQRLRAAARHRAERAEARATPPPSPEADSDEEL
jgi:hypothetical protein